MSLCERIFFMKLIELDFLLPSDIKDNKQCPQQKIIGNQPCLYNSETVIFVVPRNTPKY